MPSPLNKENQLNIFFGRTQIILKNDEKHFIFVENEVFFCSTTKYLFWSHKAPKRPFSTRKRSFSSLFEVNSFEQVSLRGELGVNRIVFSRGYIPQFKEKQG